MIFVQYVLPYLVTLLVAICSGTISYYSAIKKSKLDNETKIKEIQEQHKLDLENQRELFKLEIDKINLQHQNELEKIKIESSNQLTNNLAAGIMPLLSNAKNIKDLMELKNKINKDSK